ncbi:YfhO family protein [Streptomyces sp. NPDC006530]|uniref:YfhO family protein n=1 Tax=Streptomyces sp. NPDC006530 TaxID=3364750 RepID=UPI0036A56592
MPTLEAAPAPPVAPVRGPAARSPRTHAAALSALITLVAVCGADAVAGVIPLGPLQRHTRAINDLGNQFVPFHAHLWDLLHGRAEGGLLLNWQSGYGTSFLPDLGTYLGSPFALLVALFPRDRIDLAVYTITVLKMAAAAAAMTVLLLALRPVARHRWAAGVLGAAYALCGWSVLESIYNPMWLDGLIAFPLLCLVGHWARSGRRPVLGPLIVALAWIANFYTAYMATIGAGLVLLLLLYVDRATETQPTYSRIRAALLAARSVAIGVGLSAPILFTIYLGTRHAHPGWVREFAPVSWPDYLARTLPGTYSFSSPAVFLGTGALFLACTLGFHRAVPRRERFAWSGLVLAVALSFQWKPAHLAWHAFATPNGSPYRQTFVLCGLLVIAAWISLSYGTPGRRALLGGGGVLALIALGAAFSELVSVWTYPLLVAGLAATVGGLALARRGRRGLTLAALALLAGAQIAQAGVTVAYGDQERAARMDGYPAWDAEHTARATLESQASGWPAHRTDPGRRQITNNDPLLLGGEGGAYYSSLTPEVLHRTLTALGGGWTSRGRAVQSLDNPVTDAIFSVGARIRVEGKDGEPVLVRAAATPPLVTLRPAGPQPAYGDDPFANQELLLGARVYTRRTLAQGCPAGTDIFLWAPEHFGSARLGGGPAVEMRGGAPSRRAPMLPFGTSAGPGPASHLTLSPADRRAELGCLDRAALARAVDALRTKGAAKVTVSDSSIRAELPAGATGTAVFAMPRIAGWSCRVDGAAAAPAGDYLGLTAVALPAGAHAVECSFRPPGLRSGSLVGGAALLALLGVAGWGRLRRGAARLRGTRSGEACGADLDR